MLARGHDVTIEYEVVGSGLEVVILLPALGADRSMWTSIVESLASAYTLVLCETGGHQSAGWPDATLDARADAVRAAMDALALEQAHVVGVSMGGMIAQILAASTPDRVRSLVLMSTAVAYTEERRQEMRDRADIVQTRGIAAIAEPTVERWLAPRFRAADPGATDAVRRMLLGADPNSYAGAAVAVSSVDTVALLPAITAPTLVLTGDLDASLPLDARQLLISRIPTAEHADIAGGSHLLPVDSAAVVSEKLLDFLGRHRSDDPELDRLTPSRVW